MQEILIVGPATAPVWIAGLSAFAFWPRFAPSAGSPISWVVLVAAALIGRGRPYYIAPAYPLLMAGGAVALEAWLPRLAKPALAAPVLAVGGADRADVPARPAGRRPSSPISARWRSGPAPENGSSSANCRNITPTSSAGPRSPKRSARPIRRLPPDDRERAVFFAWNYGDAAAIDVFGAPWACRRRSAATRTTFCGARAAQTAASC